MVLMVVPAVVMVEAAVDWVTFSASPSDTHLVMVMVTADTSQCPGGSGTHRPSDTTKDTDSVLTGWEVVLADMEDLPEDMVSTSGCAPTLNFSLKLSVVEQCTDLVFYMRFFNTGGSSGGYGR